MPRIRHNSHYDEIPLHICRGTYIPGTKDDYGKNRPPACGHCERCEAELLAIIDSLLLCCVKRCKYNGIKCIVHKSRSKPCPYELAKVILDTR